MPLILAELPSLHGSRGWMREDWVIFQLKAILGMLLVQLLGQLLGQLLAQLLVQLLGLLHWYPLVSDYFLAEWQLTV